MLQRRHVCSRHRLPKPCCQQAIESALGSITFASLIHDSGIFKLPAIPRVIQSSSLGADRNNRSLIAFSLLQKGVKVAFGYRDGRTQRNPLNGVRQILLLVSSLAVPTAVRMC